MAIAFRSADQDAGFAGDLIINVPAGVADGDFLIAHVAVRPHDAVVTTPSGWTLLRRVENAGSASNLLAVYWRVASSEPASYTWTMTGEDEFAGSIQSFTGVDTAHPIDVENGQSVSDPGSSREYPAPSITTTAANAMLVAAASMSSSCTWTPPSGMTESWDTASRTPDQTSGESGAGAYALQASPGSTGAKTFTASSDFDATTDNGCTHILALRPKLTLAPSGIDSAEEFGSHIVNALGILPSGIGSAEAFGTLLMGLILIPSGIAASEAFGAANVAIEQFLLPNGLASAEAFGTLSITIYITPAGIESVEIVSEPGGVFFVLPREMAYFTSMRQEMDFER